MGSLGSGSSGNRKAGVVGTALHRGSRGALHWDQGTGCSVQGLPCLDRVTQLQGCRGAEHGAAWPGGTQGTGRARLHGDGMQRGWKTTHAPWGLPPVGRLGQWAAYCSSTLHRGYPCARIGVQGSRASKAACLGSCCVEDAVVLSCTSGMHPGYQESIVTGGRDAEGLETHMCTSGPCRKARAACCTAAMDWRCWCGRTGVRGSCKRAMWLRV